MSETPEPIRSHGVRITWADLPGQVRGWVSDHLGEVTEVFPQQGGFSPGTADRVRGARGSGFVKAVGESLNSHTPGLIAREIEVLGHLPAYAGAPDLLSSFDERIEGERWVALLVEDIPGRHPHAPWAPVEVSAALDGLRALVDRPLPEAVELPRLETDLAGDLSCWPSIVADPPDDLDSWVVGNVNRLEGVAASAAERLHGDHLVHTDIRADNLLVTETGEVRVVDWPWACRGAPWFDSLTLLLNVRVLGGPDVCDYEGQLVDLGATGEDIDAVLAGLLGYCVHAARLPAPAGLPTLRAFQRAQGEAAALWLRERWDE